MVETPRGFTDLKHTKGAKPKSGRKEMNQAKRINDNDGAERVVLVAVGAADVVVCWLLLGLCCLCFVAVQLVECECVCK